MRSYKLPITALLLGIFVLSVSSLFALEHFNPVDRTINSMSIIVREATLDDEDLVESDEIGVFTDDPLCVGASVVEEAGAQVGVACWPDDDVFDDEKNGFYEDDEIFFRVWDHQADQEWNVNEDNINVINGDLVFAPNGFLICTIAAISEDFPGIEVAPNELNFGNVWEDGENDTGEEVFEIRSVGNQTLVVEPIEVEGDEFSTNFGEENVEIEPNEMVEVTVTFAPPESGEYEGSLTINHNVEDEDAVVVALWGELREPSARIELSAESHDFGGVSVEGSPRNWQLYIYSTGEADLVIDDITTGDEQFTTNFEEELTIEPDERHLLGIIFDPEDVGEFETDLEISSNASNAEVGVCHLMGQGIPAGDPEINFPDEDKDMDADPPQPQHFFGVVDVDDTEHWRMTVLNSGGMDLWIYNIVSTNEAFATAWNADSVRLRPDDHYYVDVTFTPDEEAFFNGELRITSNDPAVEEYTTVLVRGNGNADDQWEGRHFRYYQTDLSHSFAVAEVTYDGEELVPGDEIGVFTPNGLCAGAVVIPEEGDTGIAAWADDDADDGITNGFLDREELAFKVWDADAEIEAWAEPEYLAGPEVFAGNGFTRINLAAEPPEPEPDIELSEGLYHFGQVDYDDEQTEDWVFTIFNAGEGLLNVSSIDSDLGQFTVGFEGAEIESENQIEVTVTFAPDAEEHFVGRLTVQSNDPVDPVLYIDVDGYGVEEVVEPDIKLPSEGYFFGVQHINDGPWVGGPYEWTLGIENDSGGGILTISDIRLEGSEAFDTDWAGREVEVQPMESFDLEITFNPDEVRRFDAMLIIESNSPNEEEVQFMIRGYGSGVDDYFLHWDEMETSHMINLDGTYLWMDTNENEGLDEDDWTADLVVGDEVAVFDGDLCVGHLILDGENVSFNAFADDPETPYMDGFIADHEMTFRFWDWTAGEELVCDAPEFSGGDEAFAPNGESDVIVGAEIDSRERQIDYDILPDNEDGEDPDHWEWGPVAVDESVDHTIMVINSGDHDLTVTGVEVPEVLETDFGEEEVVVEAHDSFELTVTFTPVEPIAYGDIQVVIQSDDPDEPEFGIYMTGMGSEAEGHFEWYNSGINASIIIREFTMGGAAPGIGDEIAVFVPEGFFPGISAFCAGATIVEQVQEQYGLAAWGDNRESEWLLEGFKTNDEITFRVWDASQEDLYEDVNVELAAGRLNWASNGQTVIEIDVPGVFSLGYAPFPVEPVNEGETVEFDLVLNNPPVEDMVFAIVDRDGVGGELDDAGSFVWETSPGDAGMYYPVFSTTDPDDEEVMDMVTVPITVIDINYPPEFGDPGEGWEFIEGTWFYSIPEDNGDDPENWFVSIEDLNEFFTDIDEDELTFFTRPPDPDNRVLCEVVNQESYRVRVDLENEEQNNQNWNGEVNCVLVADDGVDDERDSYSRTLRMIGGISHDANARSLRSTGNWTPSSGPRRDAQTEFEYVLVVEPVNDVPEVETEADAHTEEGEWRFAEGEEDSYWVRATDVEDDPGELTWSEVEIPGGEFNDNGDGTGTFTWTPDFDAAGAYEAIFQVEDTEEGVTEINVNIVVVDVNQPPEFEGDPIPDAELEEDCGRVLLVDNLFGVFNDPDDDELRFTVVCEVEELGVEYEDGSIFATPLENWNGEANVFVTARDYLDNQPREGMLQDTLHVTVASINDAPGAFELVEPEDGRGFTDEMVTLDFSWTEAVQVPFEGEDVVTYVFVAKVEGMPDDSVMVPDLEATEYNEVNVREVVAELGIVEDDQQEIHANVEWNIIAVDTEDAPTWASNGWRTIEVNLAVEDDELSGIPEDYFLSPNFPNPFNAVTTVRFGLPAPGDVQVTVWDMHGRQVATLASGYHAAGRFEVVWDAGQIPTGVYVIRLSSGNAQMMQKAILLK